MKDEEALKSHRHEWVCTNYLPRPPTVNEADAYAAGFRAGLKHARAWRPMTEDPATWPEEGQLVAVVKVDMSAVLRREGEMLEGSNTSLVLGVSEGWSWVPLEDTEDYGINAEQEYAARHRF